MSAVFTAGIVIGDSIQNLRVHYFGKIRKRISDLGSMDSSASKKCKIGKRIIFLANANKQTQSCVFITKKKQEQISGSVCFGEILK